MRAGDAIGIEEYLRGLDRRLTGPSRAKADLLAEARGSLEDAALAYTRTGLDERSAQARAVAEFGGARELAPAYQAELAVGAARRLALRVVAVPLLLTLGSDLMWRGAPWTGVEPTSTYRALASSTDWLGYATAVGALLAYAGLVWGSRRGAVSLGAVRAVAVGSLVALGLMWIGGTVVYVLTVRQWGAALTWTPMIVGGVLVIGAMAWLARGAASCLAAAR